MGVGVAAARQTRAAEELSERALERILKLWIIVIACAGATYFAVLWLLVLITR